YDYKNACKYLTVRFHIFSLCRARHNLIANKYIQDIRQNKHKASITIGNIKTTMRGTPPCWESHDKISLSTMKMPGVSIPLLSFVIRPKIAKTHDRKAPEIKITIFEIVCSFIS